MSVHFLSKDFTSLVYTMPFNFCFKNKMLECQFTGNMFIVNETLIGIELSLLCYLNEWLIL